MRDLQTRVAIGRNYFQQPEYQEGNSPGIILRFIQDSRRTSRARQRVLRGIYYQFYVLGERLQGTASEEVFEGVVLMLVLSPSIIKYLPLSRD